MATTPPTPEFASHEVAIFWRYISSSLERLLAVAATLPPEGLNWQPPAPRTNSVAVLAMHTLANAGENLLGTLCGEPMARDHAAEFAYRTDDARALLAHWEGLRAALVSALAALPADALDTPTAHPRRGRISGREVLIVVARHTAEHLGQAELTRDLWSAQTDAGERPAQREPLA